MPIHPTAIIDSKAEIDPTVDIGPYVIIEGPVKVNARTRIRAHAFLSGWTEIGEDCDIHPFAVIGHYPQDFHYSGERSYTKVGNRVIIREGATIHRGTQPETTTVVGDECFLLATAHVGHNCRLGRGVKVYNGALAAGHAEVDDGAILSGQAMVHQFARVGTLAFGGGGAILKRDLCPFMTAVGTHVAQYNRIGMLRAGYTSEEINDAREAYRVLYRSNLMWPKAVAELTDRLKTRAGRLILDFLHAPSRRGFIAGLHQRHPSAVLDKAEGRLD